MTLLRFLAVLMIFLFSSCKNMYSKVYDKTSVGSIKCLKVSGKDIFLNNKVRKSLKEKGIPVKDNCPFVVDVYALKLSQCNSPKGKSIGADFDGYIRFSVYKGKKLIYRCQEDYKGEFGDYLIEDLVSKMKKDLKM